MPSAAPLVLGTHNQGKVVELCELLAPLPLTILALADFPAAIEVEETGDSFAANAALKAIEQAKVLHSWILGEDSGIAVDALAGAPGIFSARYAGPRATDEQNNARLLAELADVPPERRTAHYICQLALSDPEGNVRARCGAVCHGRIRREPVGSNGFGYDPLFEIVEYHRTFGQLGPSVKASLSHRARALGTMRPLIAELLLNDYRRPANTDRLE
jgi:XTP/dITP diphosphohydrolase